MCVCLCVCERAAHGRSALADEDFKPYTGNPLSKYVGADPTEQGADARAVFVNESAGRTSNTTSASVALSTLALTPVGSKKEFPLDA